MFAHTQSFVDFLKRLIMSAGVANTTKIPAHVDLSQPHTWVNCGLCLGSLSKCELGEIISFLELMNCKILNAQFQTRAYPSWSGPSMGDSGSGPQNPSRFRSVVVIGIDTKIEVIVVSPTTWAEGRWLTNRIFLYHDAPIYADSGVYKQKIVPLWKAWPQTIVTAASLVTSGYHCDVTVMPVSLNLAICLI